MVTITLNNITSLNVSLQVGDLIYAKSTSEQIPNGILEQDATGAYAPTNQQGMVGVLSRIDVNNNSTVLLVDETVVNNPYTVTSSDFIMFSKYDQSMGDVIGYYAKVKFVNNSREKAEIFSVGSEVIINSK